MKLSCCGAQHHLLGCLLLVAVFLRCTAAEANALPSHNGGRRSRATSLWRSRFPFRRKMDKERTLVPSLAELERKQGRQCVEINEQAENEAQPRDTKLPFLFGSIRQMLGSKIREICCEATAYDFETSCRKAARPTDDLPKQKHVGRLLHAVQEFESPTYRRVDPYSVLLLRLWSIMLEKDYRSSLKALYLLHHLLQEVSSKSNAQLRNRILRLSKQYSVESRTTCFYASAIQPNASPLMLRFIHTYAMYVLNRIVDFSGRFDELDGTTIKYMPPRTRNLHLKRARKTLSRAINLKLTAAIANPISILCTDAVIRDVVLLMRALSKVLGQVIRQREVASTAERRVIPEGSSPKEVQAFIDTCRFYLEILPRVEQWVEEQSRLCCNPRRTKTVLKGVLAREVVEQYLTQFQMPSKSRRRLQLRRW